ncbi:putative GIM3-Gim complex component [Zopfochytrium polystomum]|nr:putative GIM3-Gim complex component [Zopfochytrium polystomum]
MKVLQENEEADIDVSWADQQNINNFSKMNAKMTDLEESYEEKKKEKEYLDDLEGELELADEDEPMRCRIGDAYVLLPLDECKARVERDKDEIGKELEKLRGEMDQLQGRMNELKKTLYARFGKSINLEK